MLEPLVRSSRGPHSSAVQPVREADLARSRKPTKSNGAAGERIHAALKGRFERGPDVVAAWDAPGSEGT